DQLVESAGAQERRIDQRRTVRRADHDDALQLLEPVHLREERVDDALGDGGLAQTTAPLRREGLDLVEEDDRRRDLARALEQSADLLLRLAVPLGEEVARLGRDEVALRLPRHRLGEQRFPRPRRAEQEKALGRSDPEPAERLWVLERELDALAECLLRLAQSADVVPSHVRDLDHDLAQRRGLDALHRVLEVLVRDLEPLQDIGRDLVVLQVDVREVAAERLDRRLTGEGGEIGADEAVRRSRERVDVDVLGEGHAARVDREDFAPAVLVRHADDDLPVEAARPAERLVDRVDPVRRADDDDVLPRLQAVHQGEELRDDPSLDLARDLFALRRDRVELVDEDDRWRVLLRLLEDLAESLFALAVVAAHDLGAGDVEEPRV